MQKSLGGIEAKVDRLIKDVEGLSGRLGTVETAVDRVRTGVIVATVLLGGFGSFAWWALGDRITSAVQAAITQQLQQQGSSGPRPTAP